MAIQLLFFGSFLGCSYIGSSINTADPSVPDSSDDSGKVVSGEFLSDQEKASVSSKNNVKEDQSKQEDKVDVARICRKDERNLKLKGKIAEDLFNKFRTLRTGPALPVNGLKKVAGHSSEVIYLTLVSNAALHNPQILSVERSGLVLLWQRDGKRWIAYSLTSLEGPLQAVSFHAPTSLLAVARSESVKIIDVISKSELFSMGRLRARIQSLDVAPCGDSVVIAGADGMAYRWRYLDELVAQTIKESEHTLERYIGHSSVVSKVKYHPFARVFFSTDWQGVLSAWRTYDTDAYKGAYDVNVFEGRLFSEESQRVSARRRSSEIIEELLVSANGEHVFLATESGGIEVWQVRGFNLIGQLQNQSGSIYGLALSPSGTLLAAVGRDHKLRVWRFVVKEGNVPGSLQMTFEAPKEINIGNARQLSFIDENTIIAGTGDGKLLEVDLTQG